MEEILDLARKMADAAEVYSVTGEETPVNFEANRLKMIETKQTRGVAVRVLVKGRIGLASTTDPSRPRELVEAAVEMAQFGAVARFGFPSAAHYPEIKVYDPAVLELPIERMRDIGQEMVDRVREYDENVLVDAGVGKESSTVEIMNTSGARVSFTSTGYSAGVHGNLVRGTDMLDVWEGNASCRSDVDHVKLVNDLIRKIDDAKRTAKIRTATLPVVFTPKGFAGSLTQPLTMALNGKLVLQGASPLSQKLGQQVFDRRLTVYDDGTTDYSPASRPFDDEAVPVRRTPLIENGMVSNFYYDLQTAGLSGKQSTGNGFRSLGSLPSPSTTALTFSAGNTAFDKMVESIDEGLLVDQVLGAWAGNLLAGEFSGNVHLGYKIERGEIVGRVKDTMVSGNILDGLNNLAAIGDEAIWVNGSLLVPYMHFQGLGVASRA